MTSDHTRYLIAHAATCREVAAHLAWLAERLEEPAAGRVREFAGQFARLAGGDPAERHGHDYELAAGCLEDVIGLARGADVEALGAAWRTLAAAGAGDAVARAEIGGPGVAALELARAVLSEHGGGCGCARCVLAANVLGRPRDAR